MKDIIINTLISICILLIFFMVLFTMDVKKNMLEIERLKLEIKELNQHNDSLESNMLVILRKCNN